ncbi:MAG: hypothetical protein RIT14_1752 [Pseudomonadota bacterium]
MTRLALAALLASLALPMAVAPAAAAGISLDLPRLTFPAPKPAPVLSTQGCVVTKAKVCVARG